MTKTCFWAALVLLTLGVPAAAAPPPGPDPDAAGPFPRQQFDALPGKVVGVLVGGGEDVLAQEGRHGAADALCLGSGEGSYRWLYVPVRKKWTIGGLNLPVGPRGDTVKAFRNLRMADPKLAASWGVRDPFALVEVEVNGGLGAPPGDSFVATAGRVVEGTRDYPLHVAAVVADVRRRFRAHLKEQDEEITRGLVAARGRLPEGHRVVPGREQKETLFVTWLPDSDELRVVLRQRITQKALRTTPLPPPPPAPQVGDDGRPPPPPVHAGVEFGVELGMTYDVSRTGQVERGEPTPVRLYQKEILTPAEKK